MLWCKFFYTCFQNSWFCSLLFHNICYYHLKERKMKIKTNLNHNVIHDRGHFSYNYTKIFFVNSFNSHGLFLCDSFPRKRERTKFSSQGEDSVERSDGDRLTLPVPTQRRESFLYKSDSEFELASKCVTSRHHSFSEGWVDCFVKYNLHVLRLLEADRFNIQCYFN